MKYILLFLGLLLLPNPAITQVTSLQIIQQAIQKHDPHQNWDSLKLQIHIEEPRVQNPFRYSVLNLDNQTNSFSLKRNRDEHIATYIVDSTGNNMVLLNNKEEIEAELVEKYRLNPEISPRYRTFYHFYYGLPMSLTQEHIKGSKISSLEVINHSECYKVSIELIEERISKFWNIYFSVSDSTIVAVDIVFPDDPSKGERIVFNGEFIEGGVLFPKMRHWYGIKDGEYLGSDIIIKNVEH